MEYSGRPPWFRRGLTPFPSVLPELFERPLQSFRPFRITSRCPCGPFSDSPEGSDHLAITGTRPKVNSAAYRFRGRENRAWPSALRLEPEFPRSLLNESSSHKVFGTNGFFFRVFDYGRARNRSGAPAQAGLISATSRSMIFASSSRAPHPGMRATHSGEAW